MSDHLIFSGSQDVGVGRQVSGGHSAGAERPLEERLTEYKEILIRKNRLVEEARTRKNEFKEALRKPRNERRSEVGNVEDTVRELAHAFLVNDDLTKDSVEAAYEMLRTSLRPTVSKDKSPTEATVAYMLNLVRGQKNARVVGACLSQLIEQRASEAIGFPKPSPILQSKSKLQEQCYIVQQTDPNFIQKKRTQTVRSRGPFAKLLRLKPKEKTIIKVDIQPKEGTYASKFADLRSSCLEGAVNDRIFSKWTHSYDQRKATIDLVDEQLRSLARQPEAASAGNAPPTNSWARLAKRPDPTATTTSSSRTARQKAVRA